MATATKKKPASAVRRDAPAATSMEFRVYEDNGGRYHWAILSGAGATLAKSEPFATHGDAEHAAADVRAGAARAQLDHSNAEQPLAVV